MKKLYEKPSIRIVKVQSNDLLAAVSQSVDSSTSTDQQFSKENVFDDCWDNYEEEDY